MKAIAALLIIAAFCQLSHADFSPSLQLNNRLSPISVGEKLKQTLEDLKEVLRNGNATAGIPVLDPFDLKHQEFSLDNDLINIKGEVNDVLLKGLSNYVVQDADFKFVGKKITVDFLWSEIAGQLKYKIPTGLIAGNFPFYGAGNLSVIARDLHFATQANIKLDTKADRLLILSFSNTVIELGSFKIDVTGLYNDNELSALFSAVLSDNFSDMLKDFNEEIVNKVNQVLLEQVNALLKDQSLKELLAMIRG